MKNKVNFKKREGAALMFVIMVLFVLIIFSSSVAFLFSLNHRQALMQEKNMKEHYLKLSAIDVTISTLLSTLEVDSNNVEKTMIDVIKGIKNDIILEDEIQIDGQKVGIRLFYDKKNNKTNIYSFVIYDNENSKELSVALEFSGNQYRMIWE